MLSDDRCNQRRVSVVEVREPYQQVRLPAAEVVDAEGSGEVLGSAEVKAGGDIGRRRVEEILEVGGVQQKFADRPVGQIPD